MALLAMNSGTEGSTAEAAPSAPGSVAQGRIGHDPPTSPLVAIADEPPPRLVVDAPLPVPLATGKVFIQYRAEHMRIVPVFGPGALDVSPRVGHVHVTVDDLPWHFIDASGETIVVVGLPAGNHKVLVELADPTHRVIDRAVVEFVVP